MPTIMPEGAIFIGEAHLVKVFWGFIVTVILIAAVLWRSGIGGAGGLRATASDQPAAYSMGINVPRVFSLPWTVVVMIAAVAGVVVGAIGGISPAKGTGLSVLVVVIVGGLDSVLGLAAGVAIGLIEAWASGFLGVNTNCGHLSGSDCGVIRPYGLFGTAKSKAVVMRIGTAKYSYCHDERCLTARPSVVAYFGGRLSGFPYGQRILALPGLSVAINIASATGLNILAGYTGLVSLGRRRLWALARIPWPCLIARWACPCCLTCWPPAASPCWPVLWWAFRRCG